MQFNCIPFKGYIKCLYNHFPSSYPYEHYQPGHQGNKKIWFVYWIRFQASVYITGDSKYDMILRVNITIMMVYYDINQIVLVIINIVYKFFRFCPQSTFQQLAPYQLHQKSNLSSTGFFSILFTPFLLLLQASLCRLDKRKISVQKSNIIFRVVM